MPQLESLGIQHIEALHYYVRDVPRTRRFLTAMLDFREVGGDSTELVARSGQRTVVFEAGGVRLLVSEAITPGSRAQRFLARHPEGIGSVVYQVGDAAKAFKLLEGRGATPLDELRKFEGDDGTLKTFAVATPFGDTTFRFVERHRYDAPYPGFLANPTPAPGGNRFRFAHVDHLTSNFATMSPTSLWLEHVMGFDKFWEIKFHTVDMDPAAKEGSGLKSIVHKDPHSPVKFANNEPLRPNYRKSQIHHFDVDHGGSGVQHAALSTPDLIGAVGQLRKQGAPFLTTPGHYYDDLGDRLARVGVGNIDESIDLLRELHILVDGSAHHKYLLQIFMKDMAAIHDDPQAGPFFFELIQRKGDQGFGYGNFRALFESIERAQQAEGRN